LGFDFTIEYKSGSTNTVADALSHRDTEEGALLAILAPRFDFIDRLRHAQATEPALVAIHDEVRTGTRTAPWTVVDDMVTYGGHLYIPATSPLLQEIMEAVHEDGHEGVHRTLHRLRRDFHFPNMRHLVQEFVRSCPTCQRYKSEHPHPVGLLMPLPVPSVVWADIGLDIVEVLPRVNGKTFILSVVDQFSKYCLFLDNVMQHAIYALQEFHNLFQGDMTITTYFGHLKQLEDLRDVGHPISESSMVVTREHPA
jgi:hypothetical protein